MSKWGCIFVVDLVLGEIDVLEILDILGRCAALGCIEYWTVGLEVGCVWLISFFQPDG